MAEIQRGAIPEFATSRKKRTFKESIKINLLIVSSPLARRQTKNPTNAEVSLVGRLKKTWFERK